MPTYDVLSPDGFSIHHSDTYKTKEEAFKRFDEWKEGYRRQGWYSSGKFMAGCPDGRIGLDELSIYCTLVTMKRGQYLFDGKKTNLKQEMITLKYISS